jgi:hypothetical protein
MIKRECVRERELVNAMTRESWPGNDVSNLRGHAQQCASCREVLELIQALRADRDAALSDAHLPSASYVWWRAQVRARLEAAHEAERPITVAQVLASVALVTLAISAGGIGWLIARGGTVWAQLTRLYRVDGPDIVSMILNAPALAVALTITLVCVVVLTPIVFLVALSEE